MSNVVTKAEFARQQGVNKSTVTRWGNAGRLVLNARGKVMVKETLELIGQTDGHRTDLKKKHADNRGQKIEPSAINAKHDDSDLEVSEEQVGKDRAFWKAQTLDCENKMMLLEQALDEGTRVKLSDIIDQASDLGAAIKQGMLNLIDNLTPQIANISDEKEKQLRIQSEVNKLIQQLS